MRTTLTIADDLLSEAKERAARTHRTISEVVEDAMREAFARRATDRERRRRRSSGAKPKSNCMIIRACAGGYPVAGEINRS